MLWHWMHTIPHPELQTHWNFFSLLLGNIFRRRFVVHGNVHPRWHPFLPTLGWLGYVCRGNNRLFRNEENVLQKNVLLWLLVRIKKMMSFVERGQVLICCGQVFRHANIFFCWPTCASLVMYSFCPLSLFSDFVPFINFGLKQTRTILKFPLTSARKSGSFLHLFRW